MPSWGSVSTIITCRNLQILQVSVFFLEYYLLLLIYLKPLYVGFQAKEGSINGTNQNDTIKEPSDSQNKQTQIGELEYVSDLSSEQTVFVQVRLHLNNLLIKTILRYSLFRNFKPNIFQLM